MTAHPPAPARKRPAQWTRAAIDRVPTKWLITAATGVFLIATAAFGGLATAATPPATTMRVGETFASAQLSLTASKLVLLDSLDEFFITLEPGERAVAVLAEVTNAWTEPQLAAVGSVGVRDVVALRIGDRTLGSDEMVAIVRTDDPQLSPTLQPGVAAPLAFIWAVPAHALRAGDDLTAEFFTQRLYTGKVTVSGQWWDDPALTATMPLRAEERAALSPAPRPPDADESELAR